MRFAFALAAIAVAFAWPTPLPTTPPAPRPTVAWDGPPATAFRLANSPLGVTPDGDARVLVRAVLRDASGAPTRARHGTDFDWYASRGAVQWQTGLRFGGPAAIVSLRDEAPLTLRVVARRPAIGTAYATVDPRAYRFPRVVSGAIGPHLVRIGWFPRPADGTVSIARVGRDGRVRDAALVAAPASSWDDETARPGTTARYVVTLADGTRVRVDATVPPEAPVAGVELVRGKGMWLTFSGDPRDDDGYTKLDVAQIVATAQRAGLRYVELRLAYGAFDEVTPAAKPTVDALIDGFETAGIAVLAWTVPRADAFDDLAATVAALRYRTAAGNGMRGLAVDLERGDEFLGRGRIGYAALQDYLGVVRRAVGPHVLLVATVEDPYLEHLDQRAVPYAAIAAAADVLQPMVYWRAVGVAPQPAVSGSLARLRALAGRSVPIDVGGQTASLSARGAPGPDELRAGIATAKRLGALGITFFDWGGTAPAQWQALAGNPW